MNDRERALEIIAKKKVNVALLMKCFECQDDPFILKHQPGNYRGLYVYNHTNELGSYCKESLEPEEYKLLERVLKSYE